MESRSPSLRNHGMQAKRSPTTRSGGAWAPCVTVSKGGFGRTHPRPQDPYTISAIAGEIDSLEAKVDLIKSGWLKYLGAFSAWISWGAVVFLFT